MNARGPEICKAWNLSDIEAETVHSQPARGLLGSSPSSSCATDHYRPALAESLPSPAAQAAQAAHHVVLDENSAEWREQSR